MERDVWYHVCSTYDKDDGVTNYVNGQVIQKDPNQLRGKLDSGVAWQEPICIAMYEGIQENAFLGVIDEVMIWNRALSAEEVAQLFEGRPTPPAEPSVSSSGKLATAWGRVKRGR